MMTSETAEEYARPLQEPLLVEQDPPPSEDTCQRRGKNNDPSDAVDPMELEERPEEDGWIRVADWRCLWVLLFFQFVWPALLLAFGFDEEFVVIVIVLSAVAVFVAFYTAAFARRNNVGGCRWIHAIPAATWLMMIYTPFPFEPGILEFIVYFIVYVAVLLSLIVWCRWGPFNIIAQLSNRSNFYKSLEDEYFEQLREQEATEQERLEAQKEGLSYLEEIASSHPRKPPICMIVTLAATGILALTFLFYAIFVLLSGSDSVATAGVIEK